MKTNSKLLNPKTVFDEELRYKEHMYCEVKKANAQGGMLLRSLLALLKTCLNNSVLIVRLHLKYGAPVWTPTRRSKSLIRNVQGRDANQVQEISDISYKEMVEAMGL